MGQMQFQRENEDFKVLVLFYFLSRMVGTGCSFYYSLSSTCIFYTLVCVMYSTVKKKPQMIMPLIFSVL